MLRPEIGSPEQDLMKPIFYARRSVRIRATRVRKFLSDFAKVKTFIAQELDDMMLSQVHRIGTFRLFTICILAILPSFSQRNPKLS
jgi:hypothetical protein